ncbi:twin-arginine translocase TatA/TatE family subunit [Elioraea sp.]|uniref:twin-arginine translocase TatA/TatE family subunit n=1 Tax=Elioraea sp. TaxID=2185103 RepID=UPI0025BDF547|nr:twin-arginine translocase TatA/TatE family subunit [Elioraea sp.]
MSIGVWQIALLGVVVLLLFGSRKLPALGADLANGIKDFRKVVGAQFATKPAVGEDAPFEDPSQAAASRPSAAPVDRR